MGLAASEPRLGMNRLGYLFPASDHLSLQKLSQLECVGRCGAPAPQALAILAGGNAGKKTAPA
jgi:hypothetical protein